MNRPYPIIFSLRFNIFYLFFTCLLLLQKRFSKMSSIRAPKSGFAEEAQQKIHGKYDQELAGQILKWIKSTTGLDFNTDASVDNFLKLLKDGTVLCKLANCLSAGSIKKVTTSKMAFMQMENISLFLKFANEVVGIPKTECFQTVDLYEGQDPNSVLVCLSSLARKCEKMFGKPGLGPKEAEAAPRHFTEEQMKAGEGVIGLQMGSNKGETQSGQNFGNTRHIILNK